MAREHRYVLQLDIFGSDGSVRGSEAAGTGPNVTLRAPRQAEVTALHETYLDAFSTRTSAPLDAATWIAKWPLHPLCVLDLSTVVRSGKIGVGYLLAYLDDELPGEGAIGQLGVRTGFRRRGFGQAMLTSTLHRFAERGLDVASLNVAPDNTDAIRLYEKLGFVRHGTAGQ